jgi:dienelactone hydrolase
MTEPPSAPLVDPAADEASPPRRARAVLVATAALVAVALGVTATVALTRGDDGTAAGPDRTASADRRDVAPDAAEVLAYERVDLASSPVDADGTVTFRSPGTDGTSREVLATVVRPSSPPVGCAVVVHGLGGGRSQMALVAAPLALMGWTSIAPEMAWGSDVEAVPGGTEGSSLDGEMRDELVDVRRSVDWLDQHGDCHDRIVYVGVSMGAMGGVPVVAADDRVDGSILIVPGACYRTAISAAGIDPERVDLSAWDPVRFAPQLDDRPVLVVSARGDELIDRENATELHDALPDATVVWVEGGHTPDAAAALRIVAEAKAFLDRLA